MTLNSTPFWVRAYDLPLNYRNLETAKALAGKLGKFMKWDNLMERRRDPFLRFRVALDLKKPLKRGTMTQVKDGDHMKILFRYERLLNFSYLCGHLGHIINDCERVDEVDLDEAEDMENLSFGPWLRASPLKGGSNVPTGQNAGSVSRQLFFKTDHPQRSSGGSSGHWRRDNEATLAKEKLVDAAADDIASMTASMSECGIHNRVGPLDGRGSIEGNQRAVGDQEGVKALAVVIPEHVSEGAGRKVILEGSIGSKEGRSERQSANATLCLHGVTAIPETQFMSDRWRNDRDSVPVERSDEFENLIQVPITELNTDLLESRGGVDFLVQQQVGLAIENTSTPLLPRGTGRILKKWQRQHKKSSSSACSTHGSSKKRKDMEVTMDVDLVDVVVGGKRNKSSQVLAETAMQSHQEQ